MQDVKADLPAKIMAAMDIFAAKSDIRYYLNGIYVEPKRGGGCFIVATNGHAMLVANEPDAYANRAFIMKMRKDLIAALKVNARKHSKANDSVTRLVITGGFAYAMKRWYETADGRTLSKPKITNPVLAHAAFPAEEIEGKFPDWRRVIPKTDKTGAYDDCAPYTAFNPEYIENFRKAFKICGAHHRLGIKATITSPTASIAIMPLDPEIKGKIIGVLMPMKDDTEKALPKWAAKEKEKSDDK